MSVFYMQLIGKNGKVTRKVATDEAEVDQDKKRGWVEYDPDEQAAAERAAHAAAAKQNTLGLPKHANAAA